MKKWTFCNNLECLGQILLKDLQLIEIVIQTLEDIFPIRPYNRHIIIITQENLCCVME